MVREGYKQTEVGEIPEDWSVRAIGELGEVVRGGSPRPAGDPRFFNGNFIPWLTVASLTTIPKNQSYVLSTKSCLTEEGSKRSRILEKDTLIISNSGATLGVAKILDLRCCANDGVAALLNQRRGDKLFLIQYINTKTKYLHDIVASGNGQPNLNTDLIRQIKVPFPPEPEQRRISKILSDVDELVLALDKLISKKRNIKISTMQQLLTGKRRLPGYQGNWSKVCIEKDAELNARIGWQALTTKEYMDSGDYFLVTGTDLINGRVDWSSCHFVDEWRYSQDRKIQLKEGDVLLTKDGTIGKVGYVDKLRFPATLNSGVFVIRPRNDKFDPRFLFYILMSRIFEDFLSKITAGSTITHLYQKDFVTFEFYAPDIDEQKEISRLLFAIDRDIEALEDKLKKVKALKIAVMQELLTGRTRVADEQPVGMF